MFGYSILGCCEWIRKCSMFVCDLYIPVVDVGWSQDVGRLSHDSISMTLSISAHNSHQCCVCVVPSEDGQVKPETCREFKPQWSEKVMCVSSWLYLLRNYSVCHAEGFGLSLAKGYDRIASLTPVNKNTLWSFRHNQSDSCLCLIRDVVWKLAQAVFGDNILGETGGCKLKGKTGTIIRRCFDKIF
jgi:hypothetical protein